MATKNGPSTSRREGWLKEKVVALESRVERLEAALKPSRPRAAKVHTGRIGARWAQHSSDARAKAIEEYYKQTERKYLKLNPDVLHRLQERRDELNAYLRKQGFDPEPDIEV